MDELMDEQKAAQEAGAALHDEAAEDAGAADAGAAEPGAAGMGRLRELVEFLKSSGIAEFDLERAGLKLRLKFQAAPGSAPVVAAAAAPAFDMEQLARMMASAPAASSAAAAAAQSVPTAAESKNHIVKSPLVGTIYEAPSPGAAPFVKLGDVVEVGTVLCIVEAMKLMNEIESDAAGEIVARIVPGGQPVEYGQPLFEIKPL